MRAEFEELEGKRRKLAANLEELEAADPNKIKQQSEFENSICWWPTYLFLVEEMRRSRDLVDIWTDNISTVRQYVSTIH